MRVKLRDGKLLCLNLHQHDNDDNHNKHQKHKTKFFLVALLEDKNANPKEKKM